MSITKKLLIAAVAMGSVSAAAPASASVTFTGWSNGCFAAAPCTPSSTYTPGATVNSGGLVFTSGLGFTQSTNSLGVAGLGSSDLGYFSLSSVPANYSGYFDLLVTFIAPAGAQSGNVSATFSGQVLGLQNGDVFVDFANDSSNPLSLTYNGGTFLLSINDIDVPGGSLGSTLTGRIVTPVPEAATWAMMLLGFGGIGLTMRRRRPSTIAQLA